MNQYRWVKASPVLLGRPTPEPGRPGMSGSPPPAPRRLQPAASPALGGKGRSRGPRFQQLLGRPGFRSIAGRRGVTPGYPVSRVPPTATPTGDGAAAPAWEPAQPPRCPPPRGCSCPLGPDPRLPVRVQMPRIWQRGE